MKTIRSWKFWQWVLAVVDALLFGFYLCVRDPRWTLGALLVFVLLTFLLISKWETSKETKPHLPAEEEKS